MRSFLTYGICWCLLLAFLVTGAKQPQIRNFSRVALLVSVVGIIAVVVIRRRIRSRAPTKTSEAGGPTGVEGTAAANKLKGEPDFGLPAHMQTPWGLRLGALLILLVGVPGGGLVGYIAYAAHGREKWIINGYRQTENAAIAGGVAIGGSVILVCLFMSIFALVQSFHVKDKDKKS